MSVKLITDTKKLNTAINTFVKRGGDLQTNAHRILCSLLLRAATNNDVRPLNRFINDCRDKVQMTRVNSMIKWAEKFGNVTFKQNKAKVDKTKKLRLGEAMEKPFWKFKANEGVPYQPMTMDNIVMFHDRLVKDKNKCTESGIEFDHHKQDTINALHTIIKSQGVQCG